MIFQTASRFVRVLKPYWIAHGLEGDEAITAAASGSIPYHTRILRSKFWPADRASCYQAITNIRSDDGPEAVAAFYDVCNDIRHRLGCEAL